MAEISHYLENEFIGLSLSEVLLQPTHVLLGIDSDAAETLKVIGIENVFDLGSSWLFANAQAAAEIGQQSSTSGHSASTSSSWIKPTVTIETLNNIGNLPLESLRSLTDTEATALKESLKVTTIRDFAFWYPRQIAHKLVSDALGTSINVEEQQSEVLRPRFGEYPTERVYYSNLTMLQMGETLERKPLQSPVSLVPAVDQPMGFGKLAVGALLTFSQSWYAKGVTLGHMLHSLALAPGEATRIAVIDWSRRTSATATEAITQTEQLDNSTQHARAISEVQNAVANELQSGGSISSGWAKSSSEASTGAASAVGFGFGFFGSASGSTTHQEAETSTFAESTSWSVGSRSISADMSQRVNDRTEQYANSVRNRRATAVREVSQSEHEEVSTRIVANYNHMHALTIQYYEVVQVYQVAAQLHQAERCLFVPFELLDFAAPNAMDVVERFRGALVRGALTARARDLLVDNATMVAIKPVKQMRIPNFGTSIVSSASANVAFQRNRASESVSSESGSSATTSEEASTNETAKAKVSKMTQFWDSDTILRISNIYGRAIVRPGSNALYLTDDTELIGLSFSGISISSVRIDRPGISTTENTFSVPADSARIDFISGVRLPEIDAIYLAKTDDPADSGRMELHCVFRGRPFTTDAISVDLGTGTAMQKVVTLQTDEIDRQRELLAHLQANRVHYSQIVFRSLDSATIVMLLSPFSWNGKVLIDQVEPTPLTAAGNYLVFRAPIGADEPSGVTRNGNNLNWGEVLRERGIEQKNSDTRLVPIPTDGVFAEAVLGRSNSAEKLDITRFWNWQDSPIPLQPPEISPVGTGSRGTAETLTPGDLNSPVLNIVNPTALPEPAGLSASLGALATANLFRDMSGLQGTQALSQAGLSETLEAASQAGQLASTNLQTEAQKLVAMGQIAADVAKTAMGIPSKGSTAGISADGARINHGRDMDSRSVPGSGSSSSKGNVPEGTGNIDTDSKGSTDSESKGSENISGSTASREEAYADRGALGYSPKVVASTIRDGLGEALSSVFGGSSPAPAKSKGSSKDAALLAIKNFKENPNPGRFNLVRAEVADGLERLVNSPFRINQGSLYICGPAVFFRIWIERDPLAFVSYAISLFNKGYGYIGNLKVMPNAQLKGSRPDKSWGCPVADWMVMCSLRDEENLILDYNGTPDEEVRGATEPSEIANWLRATGLYSVVREEADSFHKYGLTHAKSVGVAPNVDTIFYVHSRILPFGADKPGFLDTANHFLLLRSSVKEIGEDVEFRFWSWGDPDKTARTSKKEFSENYFGNILAKI